MKHPDEVIIKIRDSLVTTAKETECRNYIELKAFLELQAAFPFVKLEELNILLNKERNTNDN